MAIPLLDLKAQYRGIQNEIEETALRVMREQRFILGPEVEAFEQEIAQHLDVKYAVGLSSGTDALVAALMALDVGPNDEVITTDFSFFATVGCIARLGAKPVLVDIGDDYQIDVEAAAAKVGPKTKAIVAVHLFGQCCDVTRLAQLCPNVPIIEDAAQAVGATLIGQKAGGLGHCACFSFFPSKNLGGFGDGGLLTTNDQQLAERVRALRVHGRPPGPPNYHTELGGNFRLDALQAAILRVKLRHLDAWTERRRENATRYREALAAAHPRLVLPVEMPDCRHVYNQFVVRSDQRDALRNHLAEQQIGSAVYYPRGLHAQPCLAYLEYSDADFPNTSAAAKQVLSLPIYPELSAEQQASIADAVLTFLNA